MRTWKKSRSGMKGFLAFSETDCEHCFDLPGYFILRMYIWNGGKIHRVCTAELEDMHKKKKAILNEEILKAIAGSEKSYEEILSFIQGKTDTDSREEE